VDVRRLGAAVARIPAPAWIAALALGLWALYGTGFVGYDGMYSLLWGRDIAHARLPDFEAPVAPTPHPLANILGAIVAPLGGGATTALLVVSYASFAVLGWVAFRFGASLYSAWVGVLFAAVVLTRDVLVSEAIQASVDVPFLALVLGAATLEARQPRRGRPVLALLSVAGLLRPEAWLLSAAYVGYLWSRATPRERRALIALAVSAPLAWASFDLAVTGDPLFSLHGTQDLAADLERPRRLGAALHAAPVYLEFVLGKAVAWSGLAGCLAGLYALYERSLLPAALAALGLAGFAVLGIADLPLLTRYVLVPAMMLALFSAVAALGWLSLPASHPGRRLWAAAAALLAAVLLASAPQDRDRISEAQSFTSARRDAQSDLRNLVESAAATQAFRRCPSRLRVPNHRVIPVLAYWLHRDPDDFDPRIGTPSSGLVIRPVSSKVGALFLFDPREPPLATARLRGFRTAASNASWALYEHC
jgi:hypothetical protein